MPRSLFDALERRGVSVFQTWGMTEAPGASRATPPPGSADEPPELQLALKRDRQGRAHALVRIMIVGDAGERLPKNGEAIGRLHVGGPMVTARYLNEPESGAVRWLDTGDIARIFADGTIEIVDRAKDIIKSGGEWISSLEIESAAASHPAVAAAAVIGVHHEKWQERPSLLCMLRIGVAVGADALREHLAVRLPRWWLPDEIRFVEFMPLTATGKIDKGVLRRRFGVA